MLPQGNNFKVPFQDVPHFSPTSLHCTTSGNIEVFKDMPIKELNLKDCENLEGEWVESSVLESQVLPQGNTQLRCTMYNVLTCIEAYSLSPCLLVTGDIGALAGAPIQELNLFNCDKLTGTLAGRVCRKYMCCLKATH